MVVWEFGQIRLFKGCGKQLKDRKVYQEVRFSENILPDLFEKRITMFRNLRKKGVISEK